MKIFLKFLLLSAIAIFALLNYKIISFTKGISKTNMNDMSVREILTTVSNITKVEYYQMPFMKDRTDEPNRPDNYQPYDYIYRVYIETTGDAYLLKATQDDIDAFNALGIFSKNLTPNKITPIPYYIDIIIGLIVLIVPFGNKKANT